MRAIVLALLTVAAIAVAAPRLEAANWYVDSVCGTNGNGQVDGCASGGAGSAGAFNGTAGIQSCLTAMAAGDTCYVKNGSGAYVTANGTDHASSKQTGGFNFPNSGSAGQQITLTNYPGHTPVARNCPAGSTTYAQCERPTFSIGDRAYITINGFHIYGSISQYNGSNPTSIATLKRGFIITNNEIEIGWGEPGDGNWHGLQLGYAFGAIVRNNYIHDITTANLSGAGIQTSLSCIKFYTVNDSLVEFNTLRNAEARPGGTGNSAGGIDTKADDQRNIIRYNWIEGVNSAIRINNQLSTGDFAVPSEGTEIYGNVLIGPADPTDQPNAAVQVLGGGGNGYCDSIANVVIRSNTAWGFSKGLYGTINLAATVKNNIFAHFPGSGEQHYFELYVPRNNTSYPTCDVTGTWSGASWTVNWNGYGTPIVGTSLWRYNGAYQTSLANLQSNTPWEDNGFIDEAAFVNAPTDMHLNDTAFDNEGEGGIQLGAYGVTSCVGHTCGAAVSITLPLRKRMR